MVQERSRVRIRVVFKVRIEPEICNISTRMLTRWRKRGSGLGLGQGLGKVMNARAREGYELKK